MATTYRVVFKRTADSTPELWAIFDTLGDALLTAKSLVQTGLAWSAWVVIVKSEN